MRSRAHSEQMNVSCGPTIDRRLRRLVECADRRVTAAELTRQLGDRANAIGLVRPSYEQVRVLLAAARAERPARGSVSTLSIAVDIVFKARPAWDLANYLYGDPLPYRPGAHNAVRPSS